MSASAFRKKFNQYKTKKFKFNLIQRKIQIKKVKYILGTTTKKEAKKFIFQKKMLSYTYKKIYIYYVYNNNNFYIYTQGFVFN